MSEHKPIVETSLTCETCTGKLAEIVYESMDEFRKHMAEVHNVKATLGTRQMELHVDCANHHITTWACEIEGVKFHLTKKVEREGAMWRRLNREGKT